MPKTAPADEAVLEDPAILTQERFHSANRRDLSGPAFRTFLNLADRWGLSEQERILALGTGSRSTYYGWVTKARAGEKLTLSIDTLTRISGVLGIWKALCIIFSRETDASEWLKAPNSGPLFGGQSPLALITSGSQDGIMLVRRHLDAWRGGVFSAPAPGDNGMAAFADEDIIWA